MGRLKRSDNLIDRERFLEELGVCRAGIVQRMRHMKPLGPLYSVASGVLAAIDALATMLTGRPYYFHEKGTTRPPLKEKKPRE